jgi:crotonobetaine/carnitine-CoA ligase
MTIRDPRMPPPEECVLQPLLDRRARETPHKVFVQFAATGAAWTYAELHCRRSVCGRTRRC